MRYALDIKSKNGQSLIEVLLALGIAGILIGSAAAAISLALRQDLDIRTTQSANSLADGLINNIRTAAQSDWHILYDLQKGSGNKYFIVSSSTVPVAVSGEESILEDASQDGLAALWKFDENATTSVIHDFSNTFANATSTGNPATSSCKNGNCVLFNGSSQYLSVDDKTQLNPASMTVSAWIRLTSNNAGLNAIVVKGASEQKNFKLGIDLRSGGNKLWWEIGDGVTGHFHNFNPTLNLSAQTWYHIVGVYDDTTKTLTAYKNGTQLSGSLVMEANISTDTTKLYIGRWISSTYFFNGEIDDLRIYNRALSSAEIEKLYKSRLFLRSFYTENVNRDSGGNIAASGTDDPSTQKITVSASWPVNRTLSKSEYLTRSNNKVFNQADWSGGSGQDGPFTEPNNQYSTSTNAVLDTSGTIEIQLPE